MWWSDGEIGESGSHEELLRKSGRYASFYRLQFKEQEPRPPIAAASRRPDGASVHLIRHSDHSPRQRQLEQHVMSNDYVIPPPRRPPWRSPAPTRNFRCAASGASAATIIEHIREMGQDEREPPFFFAKPADAIVPDGGTVPYPSLTKDMHHEVELVVALKSGGRNIPVAKANDCIYGYGVGIDLTRRDLQIASRDIKRPWEVGKAFDRSAPCGADRPASEIGHPKQGQDHAQVQRQDPPGRRSRADDLERAGNHFQAVGDGGTGRRRHHHDRHARQASQRPSPATGSNARSRTSAR